MPISKQQIRPTWGEHAPPTDVVDPGDDFVKSGFPQSAVPPARQFINWAFNYCTAAIRYLSRRGVSDYNPLESYGIHDIVRGDDGCLYQSLTAANSGNAPASSIANWGALGIYRRTSAEIDAGVTPTDYGHPELNVLRYGADSTGASACDRAIAAAISVACPLQGSSRNARHVYFPAGRYLITQTIDLTSTRQPRTRVKDGLLIKGESAGGTTLVGQTGAGRAVMETTGAQWLSIEDLTITTSATGYSSVGIFQAMSKTLMQTNNQRFSRLVIMMNDNASANGGAGSVGIWNLAAEENTYDTLWINANLPLMFTAHNPSPNTGFATPASYLPLVSSHSLGMSTFAGECFFVTTNKRRPSIITEDVNSIKFANAYLANIGGAGVNQSAWAVYGSLVGVDFNGLIESHGRLLDVFGIAMGARMRATFGGIDVSSTERIRLNRGGQGQLLNCEFNITDNAVTARQLLAATPASPQELISCYLTNCSFSVNCDQQYTLVQENVLWNPHTGNITINGLRSGGRPYRHFIDSNRTQDVAIPITACVTPGGATRAEIARVVLPTVAGRLNALSASVAIEGIAHIVGADATVRCEAISAHPSFATGNSGAVTTGGTAVDTTTGSLQISAVASAAGNYVSIFAGVTDSASTRETISFLGSARLRWAGNESRAPQLQILS